MRTVTIDAAQAHLSRLVDDAARGEEIIIARAGRPVARLVALDTATPRPRRKLGRLAGQLTVPPDFDGPLPPDLLDAFERR